MYLHAVFTFTLVNILTVSKECCIFAPKIVATFCESNHSCPFN